jgi:hypothetical protein
MRGLLTVVDLTVFGAFCICIYFKYVGIVSLWLCVVHALPPSPPLSSFLCCVCCFSFLCCFRCLSTWGYAVCSVAFSSFVLQGTPCAAGMYGPLGQVNASAATCTVRFYHLALSSLCICHLLVFFRRVSFAPSNCARGRDDLTVSPLPMFSPCFVFGSDRVHMFSLLVSYLLLLLSILPLLPRLCWLLLIRRFYSLGLVLLLFFHLMSIFIRGLRKAICIFLSC